jgi:LuxR family transcriptional regulator, maltose regulon positive regulatory protein
MDDGGVGEQSGQTHRADGLVSELLRSKLRPPPARPGTVRRSSLIERLARDDSRPVVSVVAPPGYRKTTLLAQWAERNGQAFAWVSVDEKDNDPKVLLRYVAEALDAIQPVGGRVFDALANPASSVPGSVVPRLGAAFASMTIPVVLTLDDVHLLQDRECRAAVALLADHVPGGSRLALAGRDKPPLPIARLRVEGRIAEIGLGDLSLNPVEAAALLRGAGLVLGTDEVAELHQRTEGWPAGLYLAALSLREGGSLPGAAVAFAGDDRFVSQYVESEFLARISDRQRAFLTRTAVLEQMSGPLCEAVLNLPGSDAALAELAEANLLLVPLDRRGQWYRYHHLFRDVLLGELDRVEPGLIPVLRRRAASWYLDQDLPDEAVEYAIAAGDVEMTARLVEQLVVSAWRQGRAATLQRWFRWLEDQGKVEDYPMVAVWASMTAARTGRPAEAERWAEAVDRWQDGNAARPADPAAEAWAARVRAVLCSRGVDQMRADADEAAHRFAAAGIRTGAAALLQGIARILGGDLDAGEAYLENAVSAGEQAGSHEVVAEALCERSLLAMARADWDRAGDLAGQAARVLRQAGIEGSVATPLVCVVQARVAVHRGDVTAARRELVRAQRLRHLLTYAFPHLAVQARIELIRAHVALADLAGARTLMREVDELLNRRPGLGTLADQAASLRVQLARQRGTSSPGASALTAAELRVLPLLATHLSYPEVAAELFVSPHTIKSQAYSLFRKLGVSSRSQAVARARELGLLEG